jgi:hypothetical protein
VLELAGGGSGAFETCRLAALGLRVAALHAQRRRNLRRWQNSRRPFFWRCERWGMLRRLGVARVCSGRGGGGSGGTSSRGEETSGHAKRRETKRACSLAVASRP